VIRGDEWRGEIKYRQGDDDIRGIEKFKNVQETVTTRRKTRTA
jgi:hypothetical protein